MLKTESLILLILFLICAAADVFAVASAKPRAERIAKPLLMPLLLAFYLTAAKAPERFLVLALVCGFLGDTFLLGSGAWFACGLAAFLLGHVCYLAAFLRPMNFAALPPSFWVPGLLAYVLYGLVACRRILPRAEAKLRPAVFVYLVFLLGMSCAALLRLSYAQGAAFWLPFLGSLLFVASDTMLALRIFTQKPPRNSGAAVMVTYALAQLFLTAGFLA